MLDSLEATLKKLRVLLLEFFNDALSQKFMWKYFSEFVFNIVFACTLAAKDEF